MANRKGNEGTQSLERIAIRSKNYELAFALICVLRGRNRLAQLKTAVE
jgi:hypothetical protein